MVVYYDRDEDSEGRSYPMCYIHVHLNKKPLLERIKYAIQYIFGRQSRFGAFDEFIINPDDSKKFQNIVDHLGEIKKGENGESEK